mgnify:CR=1 FL=1
MDYVSFDMAVHLINVLICVNSMYIYDTHASVATFYLLLL